MSSASQAYCDRWQIETSFLTVKREFALEKARVRTFRRLENIFALCMLAYVFMIGHIRGSKRFRRIVGFCCFSKRDAEVYECLLGGNDGI